MSTTSDDREKQLTALSKATTASLHPDNQSKLQQDVNDLIQKLKDIRSGFTDAGIALDKVDKAEGPDGKPLNDTGSPFFNQWNALSKQFDDLLTQSCELAGNVGGQCWGFENSVLNFVANPQGITTDTLIQLVKGFTKGLTDDQGKIEGFEKQFTALATAVGTFANTVNAWATDRLKKDEKDLKDLQDAVQKAQDDIYDLKAKVGYVAAGIGATLFVVIALFYFCPLFAIALGLAGFTAEIALIVEYEKQIAADQAKIDDDNKKIADLTKEIALVKDAQSEMDTVKSTNIQKIVAALKSFSAIWDTAIGDGSSIQGYLEDPEKYKDLPPIVLAIYIQEKASIYSSLGNAMVNYAKLQTSSLNESGIDFEPRPVEERLWSLVELGKIHPRVNEVVQDILKRADLRARV